MAGLRLPVGPMGAVILALVTAPAGCVLCCCPGPGGLDSSGRGPGGATTQREGPCSPVPGLLLPHVSWGPWQPMRASWRDGHRPAVDDSSGGVMCWLAPRATAVGCHEAINCPGSAGFPGEPKEFLSTQDEPSVPDTCAQTPLLLPSWQWAEGVGRQAGPLDPRTQDLPGAQCLDTGTRETWTPPRPT